ncbi:hypothetical protein DYY67_0583 [Candidatus Nitrosotalea sp. TS]|nr:hypothetical protein [Candidatus Nitrosotalea sp. TS]
MMIDTISPTNQSYSDSWLENGVTYYYYITAVNAVGESHGSNEAHATPGIAPAAPQNLAAEMTGDNVLLTWQPPSSTNGSAIIPIQRVSRHLSRWRSTNQVNLKQDYIICR